MRSPFIDSTILKTETYNEMNNPADEILLQSPLIDPANLIVGNRQIHSETFDASIFSEFPVQHGNDSLKEFETPFELFTEDLHETFDAGNKYNSERTHREDFENDNSNDDEAPNEKESYEDENDELRDDAQNAEEEDNYHEDEEEEEEEPGEEESGFIAPANAEAAAPWDENKFYQLYTPESLSGVQDLTLENDIDNEKDFLQDEFFNEEVDFQHEDRIPSSDLDSLRYGEKYEWANKPENLAIRKRVYEAHVSISSGKPYTFLLDKSTRRIVDNSGEELQNEAADWLEKLLADAREYFKGKNVKIEITSGYRTARHQFGAWVRSFPLYFYWAVHKAKIRKDDYENIARYIGKSLAAPGFSNHNHGLAVDLKVKEGERLFTINTNPDDNHKTYWRNKSAFWKWMNQHAKNYHFYPYTVEPWHWEYSKPGTDTTDQFINETDDELVDENFTHNTYDTADEEMEEVLFEQFVPTVSRVDLRKRIDDYLNQASSVYVLKDGTKVNAPSQFRYGWMGQTLVPEAAKEMVKRALKTSKAGAKFVTDNNSAIHYAAYGRGTPVQVQKVTQALIDAGEFDKLRAGDSSTSNMQLIRKLQRKFGLGIDCAGYVQLAFIHAFKGSDSDPKTTRLKLGLKERRGYENLSSLPTKHFLTLDPTAAQTGDLLILKPKAGDVDNATHTVLVVDHTSKGSVHSFIVDASWGVDMYGEEVSGIARRTLFFDTDSGTWWDKHPGDGTDANKNTIGPYGGHPVRGIYRPKTSAAQEKEFSESNEIDYEEETDYEDAYAELEDREDENFNELKDPATCLRKSKENFVTQEGHFDDEEGSDETYFDETTEYILETMEDAYAVEPERVDEEEEYLEALENEEDESSEENYFEDLEPTEKQIPVKIKTNISHARSLKWEGHLKEICEIISLSPAITTIGQINGDFVKAVYNWQDKLEKQTGVIDAVTWKNLSRLLNLRKPIDYVCISTSPTPTTLFVPIVLGEENGAKPLTAIFIPKGTNLVKSSVDLIVYLHGYKSGAAVTIEDYLVEKDKRLREEVNKSGKDVIFVAPTLGPKSQAGLLARKADFFDRYIEKVIAALNQYVFNKRITTVNNIILAAHSGGGKPMLNILRFSTSKYAAKIKECWGFDSLYQLSVNDYSPFSWEAWLKANPTKNYFDFSQKFTGNCKEMRVPPPWCQAVTFERKKLPNFRRPANEVTESHSTIPTIYLKENIDQASFLKPR